MGDAVGRVKGCCGLEDLDAADLGDPIRLRRIIETPRKESQTIVKTVGGKTQVDAKSPPVLALLETGLDAVDDSVALTQRQEERAGGTASEKGSGEVRGVGARITGGRRGIGKGNVGNGVVLVGLLPLEATLEAGRATLRRTGATCPSEAFDQGTEHRVRLRVPDRDGTGGGGTEVVPGSMAQGRGADPGEALGGAGDRASEGVGAPASYVEEGADAALIGMLGELLQDDSTLVLDIGVSQARSMENPAEDPGRFRDPVGQDEGVEAEVVVSCGGISLSAGAGERPGAVFDTAIGTATEEDMLEEVSHALLTGGIVARAERDACS